MKGTIERLNREYSEVVQDAKNRLVTQRVGHKGSIGRIHNLCFKDNGLRLDITFKDGRMVSDINALEVEYDP